MRRRKRRDCGDFGVMWGMISPGIRRRGSCWRWLATTPKKKVLELSDKFDFSRADLLAEVGVYLAEAAKRLEESRQDCYLTLHGLPLSFEKFTWPSMLRPRERIRSSCMEKCGWR